MSNSIHSIGTCLKKESFHPRQTHKLTKRSLYKFERRNIKEIRSGKCYSISKEEFGSIFNIYEFEARTRKDGLSRPLCDEIKFAFEVKPEGGRIEIDRIETQSGDLSCKNLTYSQAS